MPTARITDKRAFIRLVPTKGVTSGKGFRAEWTRKDDIIDMDAVIAEAQNKGAFPASFFML